MEVLIHLPYVLEVLSAMGSIETHLIISEAGELNIKFEIGRKIESIKKLASFSYNINDIGAAPASGSFHRDGMINRPRAPSKTMSALANSYTDNLLLRTGDVTLKERRKLVLVLREMPLHRGHLESMLKVYDLGGIILPPLLTFYQKPKTLQDMIDYVIGKTLNNASLPRAA
jgi:4-hydroxy-3-polyprenylbenzoate decarboxylase